MYNSFSHAAFTLMLNNLVLSPPYGIYFLYFVQFIMYFLLYYTNITRKYLLHILKVSISSNTI